METKTSEDPPKSPNPKEPTRRRKPAPGRGAKAAAAGRGPRPHNPSDGGMTSQQLRQRRARVLQDKQKEENGQKQWQEIAEQGKERRSYYMTKFYIVIISAIIVTVVAVLNYTRPALLYNRQPPPPPLFLATRYPRDVIMDRDLPRFFHSYSIATAHNLPARNAAIQFANSRNALQLRTGNLRVILKGWDTSHVDLLLERNLCGRQFERAYTNSSSPERQDDLLMWCLLATEITEGFFMESVEMINNAFTLARKRGMLVRKSSDGGSSTRGRISNAYYIHPRLPEEDPDTINPPLPSQMLWWLHEHPESSLEDPTAAFQQALYDVAFSEAHQGRYMVLDEICQETQPKRAIAKQCSKETTDRCCYFVVPESEGGRIDEDAEAQEKILAQRSSLEEEGLI